MSCGTDCTTHPFLAPPKRSAASRRLRDAVRGWFAVLARMHARACQRRRLRELDDRLLADIGVGREAALREARKPFWR
jgi:uncharacterized protein YjiS (DUF1127 family)